MSLKAHLRLLDQRQTAEKKTITVGIVSEREDSYKTIIPPDECITPMEAVLVDYNHNRISTGAKIIDKGIQDIDIQLNGVTKKIRSRVVDIEVYKDSRMWTRENQEKPADQVPSLFENVENGRIGWVSVDFSPVNTDRDYNEDGTVKRETYRPWRLNYLSLLDVKPGQDDSFFLNVRAANLNFQKNTMDPEVQKLIDDNPKLREYVDSITAEKRTAEDTEKLSKIEELETQKRDLETKNVELEKSKNETEEKLRMLTNSPDSGTQSAVESGADDLGSDTRAGLSEDERKLEEERQRAMRVNSYII